LRLAHGDLLSQAAVRVCRRAAPMVSGTASGSSLLRVGRWERTC